MQYSIVSISKINLGDRIDAEYFKPSYLNNENRLNKLMPSLYLNIVGLYQAHFIHLLPNYMLS
jgi:hypothetical protein